MADRTWNPVDAKLYDESWSVGAIVVAACLIARCPNQYGVFDMPWGFLNRFFQGIFTKLEIESFVQEWESTGFAFFFRGGSVVWIKKKWKRAGRPSELHWKGAMNHLVGYPEVSNPFLSYYEPHWKGIESPLKGDRSKAKPPVNPDSESESDAESETKDIPPESKATSGDECVDKPKKNKEVEKTLRHPGEVQIIHKRAFPGP